jgi:hypothetical protein
VSWAIIVGFAGETSSRAIGEAGSVAWCLAVWLHLGREKEKNSRCDHVNGSGRLTDRGSAGRRAGRRKETR